LLYDIEPKFLEQFGGFEAFSKLTEIKNSLQKELNKKIDISTIDNNSRTFKEYALKDIVYV
jgi:predicted nucleotidyltransferase